MRKHAKWILPSLPFVVLIGGLSLAFQTWELILYLGGTLAGLSAIAGFIWLVLWLLALGEEISGGAE